MWVAPGTRYSSLSLVPVAAAKTCSVMYSVSAALPAIISSGTLISSAPCTASKLMRSTLLLTV